MVLLMDDHRGGDGVTGHLPLLSPSPASTGKYGHGSGHQQFSYSLYFNDHFIFDLTSLVAAHMFYVVYGD